MTNRQLDQIFGVIFTLIGFLATLGAWLMPRFVNQGASYYEAPGLTPGLLGIGMTVCGITLTLRSSRPDGDNTAFWDQIVGSSINRRRALLAILLSCGYAGVLFGRAPFIVATTLYVFAFILTFEWPNSGIGGRDARSRFKAFAVALTIAVVIGFGTKFLFQDLFLIQLP